MKKTCLFHMHKTKAQISCMVLVWFGFMLNVPVNNFQFFSHVGTEPPLPGYYQYFFFFFFFFFGGGGGSAT